MKSLFCLVLNSSLRSLGTVSFLTIALIIMSPVATLADLQKDHLNIAVSSEVDTLNPVVGTTFVDELVKDATLRKLIALDPKNTPYPVLIKEIPTFKNGKLKFTKNADGKGLKAEIEFKENANWGDGVPLTCEDLKAGWTIGSNPNVSVGSRELFTDVLGIDIDTKNPKKCTVEFKKATWEYYLNFPYVISAHLEMPIFEKFKGQSQAYERNSLYTTTPGNPGLWCGAYRVSEYKLGSHVSMVPNEHFYGKKPAIKNVMYKFILNSASLESNLLSGSVNMIAPSSMSTDQILAFEKKAKAQGLPYKINLRPTYTFSFLDLNLDHPILRDLNVRKALFMAINRDEVNKAFYEGRLAPADSFVNPADSFYTKDPKIITIYPFDKKKAAELLEKSGWKMNADGYRYKDGKKLSLYISASAELKIIENLEVYFKNSWKAIGVDLQIKNVPGRVLFSEIVPKRQFDIAFYSMSGSPESDARSMYHSSFIPTEKNSYAGQNTSGWKNAEVDKILDQEEVEFDPAKRTKLMHRMMKLYTEELPSLPVYHRLVGSVTPSNLEGYEISPSQFTEFLAIENWELK